MNWNSEDHRPLLTDDDTLNTHSHEPKPSHQPDDDMAIRRYYWVMIVVLFCSVVDLVVLFQYAPNLRPRRFATAGSIEHAMEMRSTYIGFDRLYKNSSFQSSKHNPIVNHVHDLAHVSSKEPHRVYPLYDALVPSEIGPVPPYGRHLLVNSEISTIAQFRIIDYGMERCTLAITLPPEGSAGLVVHGALDDTALNVWELPNTGKKLNLERLTWASCPRPRVHRGVITVSYGSTRYLPPFDCRWGTYRTFELTCASDDCHVEFTSRGNDISGLYMNQSQTR